MYFLCYFFIKSRCSRYAFLVGFYYGFGKILFDIYWIGFAFVIGDTGGWIAGFFAVIFLSLFLALFFSSATILAFIIKSEDNYFKILTLLLFLSFFEWVKGNIFTGFPWNPPAAIWSFNYFTMQPLSMIGTWGYSLLTIFAAGALFFVRSYLKGSFILIFPFIAVLSISNIFYKDNLSEKKILVSIIQPNISQTSKWNSKELFNNFQKHLEMTKTLSLNTKSAHIIIWSETAAPYDLSNDETALKMISNILQDKNYLITGFVRYKNSDNKNVKTSVYNSIGVISSDGKLISYYDKSHLVPFGEYIPLKKYIPFSKITDGIDNFTSGRGLHTIQINNQFKFSPLICYEVIFPGKVVDPYARPDVLINLTNDAWYGNTAGPYQHFTLARMRAVEEGLPLIRAANTGISAVVDSRGSVLDKIELMKEGVLQTFISYKGSETIYSRTGDLFFWTGFIGILMLILYRRSW